MKIRLANPSDKEAVLKLLDELGEEVNKKDGYSPHNAEAQKIGGPVFDNIIQRKDILIFVAEQDNVLVALTTFFILPNMRHGENRGHIEHFVVSEVCRGKGVGRTLFEFVKDWCRENSIRVIKLDSGLNLTDAHVFYERLGGVFTEKMFRFDF
jgi:GNAT superfamily N-acetyltransferase